MCSPGMKEDFPVDIVDEIVNNGVCGYSYEQKIELKRRRPTPVLNLDMVDGKSVRKFQYAWYSKFEWLTGSSVRNRLFCYYCLLFGDGKEWCADGISTVKNFLRNASNHAMSAKHLTCEESYKLLGRNPIAEHPLSGGRRLAALKYNERVGINRRVLSRLIHVVCHLGKRELPFHDDENDCTSSSIINKGNYRELLDLLSREEPLLGDHFSHIQRKSCDDIIENDLIRCVTEAVNVQIMGELERAKFVSVQVDETADVSCKSQISVIFRYVVDNNVEERFMGFFDVPKTKTAAELSDVLWAVINKWNVKDKIVCQTYDGATAAVMAEREVCSSVVQEAEQEAVAQKPYPNPMFIHCYAHHLNLVFLHGSKTIKSVRMFLSDLTAFHTFFNGSPKRTELLREKGFQLPETRWNYWPIVVSTIGVHFTDLQKTITSVTDAEDWDPTSVHLACGLLQQFSDFKFIYLLCLFHEIFTFSDRVFLILRTQCTKDVQACVDEIMTMSEQLSAMRNEETVVTCCESVVRLNSALKCPDRDVISSLQNLTYEILDSIISQTNFRFKDINLLRFVEITNNYAFKKYKKSFPVEHLQQLEQYFPREFCFERLKTELMIVFKDTNKYVSPKELLNYIIKGTYKLNISCTELHFW